MTDATPDDASLEALAIRTADMGAKIGEMAAASGAVVAARLALMGAAISNPLEGDYTEMRRMVPEKALALADSGVALFECVGAFQRDVVAQLTDVTMLLTGGVPSAARLAQMADDTSRRGARAMLWPVVSGAAAMAPVHQAVTDNARRLAELAETA